MVDNIMGLSGGKFSAEPARSRRQPALADHGIETRTGCHKPSGNQPAGPQKVPHQETNPGKFNGKRQFSFL